MTKKKQSLQFEKTLQRLETIVSLIDSGEESLEKTLELFEEGMKLAEACQLKLDQADQTISKLIKNNDGSFMAKERHEEI